MNCPHCTDGVVILFNSRETCGKCHGTGKQKAVHDAREVPLDPEDFGIDLEIKDEELETDDNGVPFMKVQNPCAEIEITPLDAEEQVMYDRSLGELHPQPNRAFRIHPDFLTEDLQKSVESFGKVVKKLYPSVGVPIPDPNDDSVKWGNTRIHKDLADLVDRSVICLSNALELTKIPVSDQLDWKLAAIYRTPIKFQQDVRRYLVEKSKESKVSDAEFDLAKWGRDTAKHFAALTMNSIERDAEIRREKALADCKRAYSTLTARDAMKIHHKLYEFAQELAE